MYKIFLFYLGFTLSCPFSFSQILDFSKVPNRQEGDSANISYLIQNGIKVVKGKVIAWFPKDSLSEQRINNILDTINIGINGAIEYLHAPLDWQVHPFNYPYTYYFRFDKFISYASDAGFVNIPFRKIKAGKGPWLHEVLHEMLNTKSGDWVNPEITEADWSVNMPLWLAEGLPEYISIEVSKKYNLSLFDDLINKSYPDLDSICKSDLKKEKISKILFYIGTKGVMKEIFDTENKDRLSDASAFYHLSASFVKYLAGKYGLNVLLNANASFKNELTTLEKEMHASLETEKRLWLDGLNYK